MANKTTQWHVLQGLIVVCATVSALCFALISFGLVQTLKRIDTSESEVAQDLPGSPTRSPDPQNAQRSIETFEREAIVIRVVDGDTVCLHVNLGYDTFRSIWLRLEGIDAPERGRPGFEAAKDFVVKWLGSATDVFVMSSGIDKYGRYVGRIRRIGVDGLSSDLSEALLESGLATPFPE